MNRKLKIKKLYRLSKAAGALSNWSQSQHLSSANCGRTYGPVNHCSKVIRYKQLYPDGRSPHETEEALMEYETTYACPEMPGLMDECYNWWSRLEQQQTTAGQISREDFKQREVAVKRDLRAKPTLSATAQLGLKDYYSLAKYGRSLRMAGGVICDNIPDINLCTLWIRYMELYGDGRTGEKFTRQEAEEQERIYSCASQDEYYDCGDLLDELKADHRQREGLSWMDMRQRMNEVKNSLRSRPPKR